MKPIWTFDLHQDISDSVLYTAHGDFFKLNKLHDGWNDLNIPVNNQVDYYRLQKGNVKAIFAASCIFDAKDGQVIRSSHPVSETFRHLELYHSLAAKKPKDIQIIRSKKDLSKIADYKVNFFLHIEGADILEHGEYFLDTLYDYGVRSIGLTWNYTNKLAGGAREQGGLTALGKRIFKRMQEKGMIVDLAHLNEESFLDALKVVEKPPIFTHGNCKEVYNHFRNLSDREMKALAKAGGIMGISGVPTFTQNSFTIDEVVKHIQHAVDVMGIDHVALGPDFGSMLGEKLLKDFEDTACMPKLQKKLEKAGFSEKDMEKIFHGNVMRILKSQLH